MAKATRTTTGVDTAPVVNPEITTPPAFDFATPPPPSPLDGEAAALIETAASIPTPPADSDEIVTKSPEATPPADSDTIPPVDKAPEEKPPVTQDEPTPPAVPTIDTTTPETKSKIPVVSKPFRDKGNFNKVWEVGTDVSHFDKTRLEHLIKIGHVELV